MSDIAVLKSILHPMKCKNIKYSLKEKEKKEHHNKFTTHIKNKFSRNLVDTLDSHK